ncbi:hypothetical protein [Deinococcus sp. RM]|uniref:hypothetical protein n=1 Tax=Deinococcus sp. RM TaxID=2316359 RepID=UPI003AB83807
MGGSAAARFDGNGHAATNELPETTTPVAVSTTVATVTGGAVGPSALPQAGATGTYTLGGVTIARSGDTQATQTDIVAGTRVTFRQTLGNTGNASNDFTRAVSGAPSGWTCTVNTIDGSDTLGTLTNPVTVAALTDSAFAVSCAMPFSAAGSTNVALTVTATPAGGSADTTTSTVTAVTAAGLPQLGSGDGSDATAPTSTNVTVGGNRGGNALFRLELLNGGPVDEAFILSGPAGTVFYLDLDGDGVIDPGEQTVTTTAALTPGQSVNLIAAVPVAAGSATGTSAAVFTATSTLDATRTRSVTDTLRVAGRSVTVTGSGGSRSATTPADGSFTLFVPGGWTGVTLDFTGAEIVTGVRVDGAATLATDALGSGVRPATLPVPAGAPRVVTLGVTGRPALSPDRSGLSIAPGTLRYLHVLNPGSVGALSFTKTGAFGRAFYLDSDCDGVVGAAERTPLTTVTVGDSWPRAADGTLRSCALEVEVSVPANAASGTTEAATVTAQLAWAGSAVTDSAAVTDTTTVSPPAAITKTVENLTGAPGVVGTAALARPGDRLRYCLNVTNPALDSVTDLTVSDTLTGAAGYEPGSLTLDGVALTDAADTDAGSVSGRMVTVTLATLAAGQTRQVCFEVTVP